MSTTSSIRPLVTTALVVTALYAAVRGSLRGRRAWKNMKIIQAVDTGSVWTTK